MLPLFLFIIFAHQVGTNSEIPKNGLDLASLEFYSISMKAKTSEGTLEMVSQLMNITMKTLGKALDLWGKLVNANGKDSITGFYKNVTEEILQLLKNLMQSAQTFDIYTMTTCVTSFWKKIIDAWKKLIEALKEMLNFKNVVWTSTATTLLLISALQTAVDTSKEIYEVIKKFNKE